MIGLKKESVRGTLAALRRQCAEEADFLREIVVDVEILSRTQELLDLIVEGEVTHAAFSFEGVGWTQATGFVKNVSFYCPLLPNQVVAVV